MLAAVILSWKDDAKRNVNNREIFYNYTEFSHLNYHLEVNLFALLFFSLLHSIVGVWKLHEIELENWRLVVKCRGNTLFSSFAIWFYCRTVIDREKKRIVKVHWKKNATNLLWCVCKTIEKKLSPLAIIQLTTDCYCHLLYVINTNAYILLEFMLQIVQEKNNRRKMPDKWTVQIREKSQQKKT